ncbi:unnamed protein product [Ceratitis capitata]|uniref:(Mediterranean fruit fly) hypothetical protein n=1 Tax=Ceratitis capitata TaxID=7213 RepID=A0A811U2G2_CERCA|nr:unnamed protein product [Ceratitis capitata]
MANGKITLQLAHSAVWASATKCQAKVATRAQLKLLLLFSLYDRPGPTARGKKFALKYQKLQQQKLLLGHSFQLKPARPERGKRGGEAATAFALLQSQNDSQLPGRKRRLQLPPTKRALPGGNRT